jgi:hypothetical protein
MSLKLPFAMNRSASRKHPKKQFLTRAGYGTQHTEERRTGYRFELDCVTSFPGWYFLRGREKPQACLVHIENKLRRTVIHSAEKVTKTCLAEG